MAQLRRIFSATVRNLARLRYLFRLPNGIIQILRKEGVIRLLSHIKDGLAARVRLFIIILLIILPALLALFFIKKYSVNVSQFDDLVFVHLFDKLYTGHLSFGDLFARWNEHRIFFPRLLMLLLGVITHHNTIVECYFSWFLICLMGYVFFRSHNRAFGTGEIALVTLIPIVWLIFTPRQLGNLLGGFQLAVFVVVFFFLLGIYPLATSRSLSWRFALSVTSGIVCTFSMGNGMLVWPIGLILILWMRQSQTGELRRLYLKMCYIWCLIGIAAILGYFIGYHGQFGNNIQYCIQHPLSCFAYFLAGLGGLSPYEYPAILIGLVLLILYIYTGVTLVRQTKARPYTALSLSLILFALLTFLMAAVQRTGLGVWDAVADRHSTLAILGMVGLYMVIISLLFKYVTVKTFLRAGLYRTFFGFLVFIGILGIVISYGWGITQGPSWRNSSNLYAYYISTYKVQSDENLDQVYWPPDPQIVRQGAEVLEKYRLNVFSRPSLNPEQLTLVEASTQFHIDSINNSQPSQQDHYAISISQQEETLTILGWAIDQQARDVAGGVFVTIDGKTDIPALYGLDRPDVAQALHNGRYRSSGFLASFATSVLGEGQHVISLKIVTADKKGHYEPDQNILIEVK